MSHDLKSNKENKNSVKELITEPEFAGEKKYENIRIRMWKWKSLGRKN